MATSPARHAMPYLPATDYTAPQSPRTNRLRKIQSVHALSTTPPPSMSKTTSLKPRSQQQRVISDTHKEIPAGGPVIHVHHSHSDLRSRANSDAALDSVSSGGPLSKRNAVAKRIVLPGLTGRHTTLEALLRDGPVDGGLASAVKELRYLILTDGVDCDSDGMSSLRIYVWLVLLYAPPLATNHYLDLIHRGPSPAYAKIRNDTFRTLATDPLFRRRVSEASLIRVLNAVAWKLHDAKEGSITDTSSTTSSLHQSSSPHFTSAKHARSSLTATSEGSDAGGVEPGIYVQGMNVLAAPFLYAARSETEAFVAFHRFLTFECPGYVRGAMDGVHRGLSLVDKVLAIVDSKLSSYLLSKGMHAELYAFPSVLTLCACTPPLPEVLHLWDFLFAYGPHLNVLCIVAQLVMMRDMIMNSPSPMKVLRSFPPLQANKIKILAISFALKIPSEIYEEIIMHAK